MYKSIKIFGKKIVISKNRKETGKKVTLTYFTVKLFAAIYKAVPNLNGKISYGKFVPYTTIDSGLLCDINNGEVVF